MFSTTACSFFSVRSTAAIRSERISPDLTYNTTAEMGDIPYHTVFSISESPLQFGLIYIGTDDGKVRVTRDGGKTWNEITAGLPYQKWVSRVCASQLT